MLTKPISQSFTKASLYILANQDVDTLFYFTLLWKLRYKDIRKVTLLYFSICSSLSHSLSRPDSFIIRLL